ncbi:CRAL/TRIO domain-containing protein [Xylariomycetidae sp. FL0641]|nr:CRAL/TRIO domain-containing protein [Xylariomycetidae sp. FL0641]
MEQLPGRPGNLTPEEEEKLRKLWETFLQITGILEDDGTGEADAPEPDKPKKKRLGLSRKKKEPAPEGNYRELLAKMTPEEIRTSIWDMVKHDNPDAIMLRYLRARKWVIQDALNMLLATLNWRHNEMHVDDDIMVKSEESFAMNENSSDEALKKEAQEFLTQARVGKGYCYGIDKAGRPICIVRSRLHKPGDQSQPGLERYIVNLIETTRLLLSPPVDTGCIVFDLSEFSMANMDWASVKFMAQCFQANYPESLGVVLVYNPPFIFKTIWPVVSGFLDPVVANKIKPISSLEALEEYIDADKIPADLGGKSGWAYHYVEPVPGENDRMKDTETRDKLKQERAGIVAEYENKTVEWLGETDEAKRASINTERGALAKKLREQYFRLDPYVRARSYYDRTGVIRPDGSLDYYAYSKTVPATQEAATQAAVETSADDVD